MPRGSKGRWDGGANPKNDRFGEDPRKNTINGGKWIVVYFFLGGVREKQDPCSKHEFPVMHLWLKNDLRPHQFMDGRRFRMTSGRVGG